MPDRHLARYREIAILIFDDFAALDVVGPLDAFVSANQYTTKSGSEYHVRLVGLNDKAVTAESGLRVMPHTTLRKLKQLDTLVIPGGSGLRRPDVMSKVAEVLPKLDRQARRVVSVCTGVYALAEAGLVTDRAVTTHWRFAEDVRRRFPRVKVNADALFLRDGKYYTSGGVTAGIDLALSLIEEDMGSHVALSVARELVMHLRRTGGQAQFSEPLKVQTESVEPFGDLLAWVTGNLDKDLTVETLARKVGLCTRHFSRRFAAVHGSPPAHYIESLRLADAKQHLAHGKLSIERIAGLTGFRSADAFTRSFRNRVGLAPTQFRKQFTTTRSGTASSNAIPPTRWAM